MAQLLQLRQLRCSPHPLQTGQRGIAYSLWWVPGRFCHEPPDRLYRDCAYPYRGRGGGGGEVHYHFSKGCRRALPPKAKLIWRWSQPHSIRLQMYCILKLGIGFRCMADLHCVACLEGLYLVSSSLPGLAVGWVGHTLWRWCLGCW